MATRSLAESKLDLGANEPKVVEVRNVSANSLFFCRKRSVITPCSLYLKAERKLNCRPLRPDETSVVVSNVKLQVGNTIQPEG